MLANEKRSRKKNYSPIYININVCIKIKAMLRVGKVKMFEPHITFLSTNPKWSNFDM